MLLQGGLYKGEAENGSGGVHTPMAALYMAVSAAGPCTHAADPYTHMLAPHTVFNPIHKAVTLPCQPAKQHTP